MNISLDQLLGWVSQQAGNLILIGGIFAVVLAVFRGRFINALGIVFLGGLSYLFVQRPQLMGDVGQFLGKMVGILK